MRGWLRRFAERAEALRSHFTSLAVHLSAACLVIEPRGSPEADAIEAIVLCAKAAEKRFGISPLWSFVSGATQGGFSATPTRPFRAPISGEMLAP